MAARKKTAKRKAPAKRKQIRKPRGMSRGRPSLAGSPDDSETLALGAPSAGAHPLIWDEMLAEFPRLTEADRTLAEDYCRTVYNIDQFERALDEHGPMVASERGWIKNPIIQPLGAAQTHLLHIVKEFGGTPRARSAKNRQARNGEAPPVTAPKPENFYEGGGDEG